jgi:dipeptidyl aminopeptidase/acylaminoacyl peptidase
MKVRHLTNFLLLGILLLSSAGLPLARVQAQGQNIPLPADLFILTDDAQVMRIGAGGSFATQVTPTDQRVVDFAVAPDGQWIAYRTAGNADGTVAPFLAMTSIEGQSGQILEFETAGQPPITGRGQTLAWSPDATAIAYTTDAGLRVYLDGMGEAGAPAYVDLQGGPFINLIWSPGSGYLAAEAESDVWWVYRRESGTIRYAGQIPGSAGVAWVRAGVLALAPPAGGLVTLDVRDGTQSALIGAEVVVSKPTLIEGGRLIFLVHEASGQRFAARRFGTISTNGGDFATFDATVELTGAMTWLPDGVALLATVDGALTILEPRTNSRRELMASVKYYAWGPLPPTELPGLVMGHDLYFLSRDDAGVAQIWALGADGTPARQITIEPRNVLDFAISPNGSQIAYSTGGSLIVANIDGTAGRELSPIVERPGAGAQPAWSPDGQLIAFVRDGIWIVPSIGGGRTELLTDSLAQDTPPDQVRVYLNPRWSPDGTRLLIDTGYYEGIGLSVLPITGGEALPLPVFTSQGDWLPDGRVLVWDYGFAYVTPGLYVFDTTVPDSYTTVLDETWSVLDAAPLANEAALILRTSGGDGLGPGTAQPYLVPILPEALPIPQGQGGLIEAPTLSTDGQLAAGLRAANYGNFGLAGRLVIINLESGERFAIQTPGEVWGLQWGG